MTEDALRIVARLGQQWGTSRTELGYRQSRRVLDSCQGTEQPRLVGRALASTANLGSLLEPSGDWASMFERAVDLLDRCGDRKGLGIALYWYARFTTDVKGLDSASKSPKDDHNASLLAWSLMNKATVVVDRGHPLPTLGPRSRRGREGVGIGRCEHQGLPRPGHRSQIRARTFVAVRSAGNEHERQLVAVGGESFELRLCPFDRRLAGDMIVLSGSLGELALHATRSVMVGIDDQDDGSRAGASFVTRSAPGWRLARGHRRVLVVRGG